MKKLFIGDIVSQAWDLAVKHWPVFLIITIVNSVFGSLSGGVDSTALSSLGQHPDPMELAEALTGSFNPLFFLIGVLVSTYLGFVTYRMLVNVMDYGRPYNEGELMDVLKVDLAKFGFFFGVELVFGLALCFGFALCVIPGLFLLARWIFVPVIAATEDVSFSEAFGRSWRLTEGHFLELFLLGITAIGIAIVGFCACCVGLLFAEIVINFMLIIAYYELKKEAPVIEEIQ